MLHALLLVLALLSLLLLALQAVRRVSLSAPGVVWPAIALFPFWLGLALYTFGAGLLDLLTGGWTALLSLLVQGLLSLLPLLLFLVIYGKLNLYPGGQDPVRRLGWYGVGMAVWFQGVSALVLAAALTASAPFLNALVQTIGTLGLGLFLLLMLCPFGFLIALPIWGSAIIVSVALGAAAAVCGTLCTASTAVCVHAAVRLARKGGKLRWFHLVLALLPAANWILLLFLLRRTRAPAA